MDVLFEKSAECGSNTEAKEDPVRERGRGREGGRERERQTNKQTNKQTQQGAFCKLTGRLTKRNQEDDGISPGVPLHESTR